MTYCGDQTLLTIRNEARTRKNTWATRGRRGAARIRAAIRANATTNSSRLIRFSAPRPMVPSTGHRRTSKKYQIQPQSAPRVEFSWKKRDQPEKDAMATGTFTTSHATAALAAVTQNARSRPARRH